MKFVLHSILKVWLFLPDGVTFALARTAGLFVYCFFRKRRRTALENLRAAFKGEKSEQELRAIARGSFQHMTLTYAELLRLSRHREDKSLHTFLVGTPLLDEVLSRGKGAILLTGHIGNWEVGASSVALLCGHAAHIVARRPSQGAVADFLTELRAQLGVQEIPRNRGMIRILRALKEGHCVAIALDQHASKNNVQVPFFGRPAKTFTTPALLSIREGIPVLPAYTIRLSDGRIKVMFLPEISPDLSGDSEEENVLRTTTRYSLLLEDLIRQHPEQWLWMHRRWR